MGKSVPSPAKLQDFARVITSNRIRRRPNNQIKPTVSKVRPPVSSPEPAKLSVSRLESKEQCPRFKVTKKMEENSRSSEDQLRRTPLAEVVADCVKRWFQDTLKEAKAGDSGMQVLVGQMYYSGYGVTKDAQKGRAWMNKASRSRSSVWKVCEKRPGYNASDSDSDDTKANNQ